MRDSLTPFVLMALSVEGTQNSLARAASFLAHTVNGRRQEGRAIRAGPTPAVRGWSEPWSARPRAPVLVTAQAEDLTFSRTRTHASHGRPRGPEGIGYCRICWGRASAAWVI